MPLTGLRQTFEVKRLIFLDSRVRGRWRVLEQLEELVKERTAELEGKTDGSLKLKNFISLMWGWPIIYLEYQKAMKRMTAKPPFLREVVDYGYSHPYVKS